MLPVVDKIASRISGKRRFEARRRQMRLVRNKDFTVFSNDCWGAEVYKYLSLPFNTPFIGLFLMAPCYVEFLRNPKYYIAQDLVFQETSRYQEINKIRQTNPYPLATLGGKVEVSFLHYHSVEEAREKWQRRVARINWDNLLVKFDGSKDGATPELLQEFEQMPYRRLLLVKEPVPTVKDAIVVSRYTTNGAHMFQNSMPDYDLVNWINTGNPRFTLASWIMHKLLGVGQ
ncbi:DUF1919 domain-containing protein [Hymenobacter sp. HSC-4F20]|uniref:DUF1919 domain-containing protein n=1 Tax=Hymenobacter sp. HSC-4F20 TaxID=2864135 RepID=UPI001C73124B|nr:DUF1919 domain-containing protein [Hymenobacter sp. HSC-4F20]MBX0292131.1 DUF1919 domain-containing protein [Hymenobacter sp. HSC-4F20]